MKYILLSICCLLIIPFSFSYAQEDNVDENQVIQKSLEEELTNENSQEQEIIQQEVIQTIPSDMKPNGLEIGFAILAPLTFILIGYLLIKKFKL